MLGTRVYEILFEVLKNNKKEGLVGVVYNVVNEGYYGYKSNKTEKLDYIRSLYPKKEGYELKLFSERQL